MYIVHVRCQDKGSNGQRFRLDSNFNLKKKDSWDKNTCIVSLGQLSPGTIVSWDNCLLGQLSPWDNCLLGQ